MHALVVAIGIVLVVIGATAVTLWGEWWSLPLAADWGGIDAMMTVTTVVTGWVFIAINLVLAFIIYRFSSHRRSRGSHEHDNPRVEWLLIGLTAAGITVLLAPGLIVYAQVISEPEDPLVVDVVAEQWQWNYRFAGESGEMAEPRHDRFGQGNPFGVDPEDPAVMDDRIVRRGPLVLPKGRPVLLQLRSRDVIHIYFVPEFRVKLAAVPGTVNEMWFRPTETGSFDAACTEFCGVAHHGMVGPVQVVEEDEFEEWLLEQQLLAEVMGLIDEPEEG